MVQSPKRCVGSLCERRGRWGKGSRFVLGDFPEASERRLARQGAFLKLLACPPPFACLDETGDFLTLSESS